MEGDSQPHPELSPDDFSSPNPEQDAPLLQAQQRSPARTEREETEVTETGAYVEEVRNLQKPLRVKSGDQLEETRSPAKNFKKDRKEEKECEDKDDAERETVDEGFPTSKGSEDESEEASEGQKENSDANNNSLETQKDEQDELIEIPDSPVQVGCAA